MLTSSLESFSIVSVEAAYFGKPIVSFDSRGVKEIFKPGMGVIVESREPADLVAAMIRTMKKENTLRPGDLAPRRKSLMPQGKRDYGGI